MFNENLFFIVKKSQRYPTLGILAYPSKLLIKLQKQDNFFLHLDDFSKRKKKRTLSLVKDTFPCMCGGASIVKKHTSRFNLMPPPVQCRTLQCSRSCENEREVREALDS